MPNSADTSKRMTFYATPTDQENTAAIREVVPHYTFNSIVREGMRLLKQSLQSSTSTPQSQHPQVECQLADN